MKMEPDKIGGRREERNVRICLLFQCVSSPEEDRSMNDKRIWKIGIKEITKELLRFGKPTGYIVTGTWKGGFNNGLTVANFDNGNREVRKERNEDEFSFRNTGFANGFGPFKTTSGLLSLTKSKCLIPSILEMGLKPKFSSWYVFTLSSVFYLPNSSWLSTLCQTPCSLLGMYQIPATLPPPSVHLPNLFQLYIWSYKCAHFPP